jgi:hypothetical protein
VARNAEPPTGYGEFWAETEPPRRGRHSRRGGFTWPVRLLALLIGVLVLAVAGGMAYDLLSPRTLTGDPMPPVKHGPAAEVSLAPAETATTSPAAKPKPTPTPKPKLKPKLKPKPKATVVAKAAPAPAGPVEVLLAPYLDNVGVTSDSSPGAGNLDGSGNSFSAQALAASGVRGGSVITYSGVSFRWPDAAVGAADNVTAAGQTLTTRGSGSTLAFLVTAGYGPAEGTATVEYAGGSSQQFTISAPDWQGDCPSADGPGVAVYTPNRNQDGAQACVFYASVRLRAGQTVTRIILPNISTPVPGDGVPSLHIFAITIH